jgi:segregation and condensation protein A
MEFTVKVDRFEGPYTKLLELIESRKLSITEIDLASVSDEYIAFIRTLDQKNIVDISQFIVVAATLMLMKAKSLLPGITYTNEEEKQIHDLEYKLELFSILSSASDIVSDLFSKKTLFSRQYILPKIDVFVPDERVSSSFLQSIALLTLQTFEVPKVLTKVAVEHTVRIEHVIESLLERIKSQSISLSTLAGNAETKEEQKKSLIVNFIALLELLRTGVVHAEQQVDGGDIIISPPQVLRPGGVVN